MNRRRFLTIAAAFAASPVAAGHGVAAPTPAIWTGRALGADARVVLLGASAADARRIFAGIEAEVRGVEGHFSLHADSALVRLNRDGRLAHPAPEIVEIFALAGAIHDATGGAFDPTVQPLWTATALGRGQDAARKLIGWHRVRVTPDEIRLDPGMALTFNGIAQGHAADRVAAHLRRAGCSDVLIDMGEVMALGRNGAALWQAGIAAPDGTTIARIALSDRALATSSPMGTRIGAGAGHIIDPSGGAARWSTVSVSAKDAATADALSTAFCVMDAGAIARTLAHLPAARIEAIA